MESPFESIKLSHTQDIAEEGTEGQETRKFTLMLNLLYYQKLQS